MLLLIGVTTPVSQVSCQKLRYEEIGENFSEARYKKIQAQISPGAPNRARFCIVLINVSKKFRRRDIPNY